MNLNKKIINFKVSGIKCDVPGCTFLDTTIKVKEYKDWLNKPCPLCGAPLLTEKDYQAVKWIQFVERFFNCPGILQVTNLVLWIFGKNKRYKFDADMNGTGQIKFKNIREEK
jgi:hypothetical protein